MTLAGQTFLVLFQILANIWPPPPPPPPPPPVQKTLGSQRDGACSHDRAQGNMFGENDVIRGEGPAGSVPAAVARAVAAARIAQDRGQAERFLTPFLGDGRDSAGRYARVQLAYALLRLVPITPDAEAETILRLLSPEAAFAGSSDAHYIRAVLLRAQGRQAQALVALDRAVAINPRFYNAVMLRSLILLADADQRFRATGACEPLIGALQQAVVPVAQLGACPLQLAHFRLALHRALPQDQSPRRETLVRVVDLALAYAARKDVIHARLLQTLTEAEGGASHCFKNLRRHDFGNPVE